MDSFDVYKTTENYTRGQQEAPVFPQLLVDSQRVFETVLLKLPVRNAYAVELHSFFNSFGDHTSRPSRTNYLLQ